MKPLNPKEEFEFLNSEIWLKYTHERYLSEEETLRRVYGNNRPSDWSETWQTIVRSRKIGAVPLFIESIGRKFWFFPSDSINKKILEIERLGNQLHEKIKTESNFKQSLISDAAIEEAITSAIYEGANTTRSAAKQLLETGRRPATKDEWMLLNNYEALNYIKENSNVPVTLDLILKIHQIVTKNTMDEADINYVGKFRDDTVYVVSSKGERVHEGIPFDKIEDTLTEAIKVVTKHPRYIHPLLRGVILHYMTAYIHPFFDGNGRTARTLFYFKSIKHQLKFVELLSISAHLKNTGNQYEKSFEVVKQHDWDLTYFINYCLESLLAALKIVEGKVEYLLRIKGLQKTHHLNDHQIVLLQRLALQRYRPIDAEKFAQETNRSRELARQELKDLEDKKFLSETKVGKKNVYHVETKFLKEAVRAC